MSSKLRAWQYVTLALLYVIFLISVITSTLHNSWIQSGGYYVHNKVEEFSGYEFSSDKARRTNITMGNSEFVMVDKGYYFDGAEDFEYYGTYESPITINIDSSVQVTSINYKELFKALINDEDYDSLGIFSTSLDGEVKAQVRGSDSDRKLLKEFIRRILGSNEGVNSLSTSDSNGIKGFGIKFRFHEDRFNKELESNLPHVSYMIDVYRRAGSDKEFVGINGFSRVSETDTDIINVKDMPETLYEAEDGETDTNKESTTIWNIPTAWLVAILICAVGMVAAFILRLIM